MRRPVTNSTHSNGKNAADSFHQQSGVDNPAFAQQFHNPDALPGDHVHDKDASDDQKPAQPIVVSLPYSIQYSIPFIYLFIIQLGLLA